MSDRTTLDRKSKIREFIIQKLLNGRSVADDENLLLSGLVDSLGVFDLVAFLEKTFELTIPLDEVVLEHFSSIDTISAYVASKQAG
ncbi:MAG: acyl carrier protein [Pseudomonadota bacterium]